MIMTIVSSYLILQLAQLPSVLSGFYALMDVKHQ